MRDAPSSWSSASISEIASVKTGPFGSALHESDYVLTGTPIVTVEHLSERGIQHTNLPLVGRDDVQRLGAYQCRPGDILFSRVGSIDRNSLVSESEDGWLFSGRLLRVRVDTRRIFPPFLSQIFSTAQFKDSVRAVAVGQTMPSLNTKLLGGLTVCFPDLSEQRALAEALADADKLILSLEELITKKRAIELGMMQRLLNGSCRLPGFTRKWRDIALGDVATFSKGMGLPKSAVVTGGEFPCIHYGELFTNYGAEISNVTSSTNHGHLPIRSMPLDVLMPTSDVTPRGLAKASALHTEGVILGGDILVIRPDGDLLYGPFLAQVIRYDANQVLQLVRGSTVFHLYASDMKNFKLAIPELDEQRAICAILGETAAALDLLSRRLVRAKQIKHGMMQELLTGGTRLAPVEVAA